MIDVILKVCLITALVLFILFTGLLCASVVIVTIDERREKRVHTLSRNRD